MDVSDSDSEEGDDSQELGDDHMDVKQTTTTVPPRRSTSPLPQSLSVQGAHVVAVPTSAKPLIPAVVGGGLKRNADGTVVGPKVVPRRQKPTREVSPILVTIRSSLTVA